MSGVNNREQVSEQVDKQKESGSPDQISRPWNLRRVQIWSFVGFLLVAFAWSVRRVDLSFSGIIEIVEGWPATWSLLKRMVPPSLPSEDIDLIISLSLDTFFMAFAGTAVGLVLGIPLGLLSARNVMPWASVRALSRAIIVFSRAIPALVFAIFFVRIYGIGVLPGILAIGIHSIGMIGKLQQHLL